MRFVASAWPSRTPEEKERFETMVLDATRHPDEGRKKRWRSILGRLLALIPEEDLVLVATRDLRQQMERNGELDENGSIQNSSLWWGEREDWEMEMLRREGVDMDSGPNRMILDASNALDAKFKATPGGSEVAALAALWSDATALMGLVDDNPGLHRQVDHSAWGHISNAVERVASSQNYAPGIEGLPDLDTIFAVLDRLSSSRYPE